MKDFCHLESNDRALINHVLSLHLKTTLLHYRLLLFYRLCLARCIISIAIKHFKFSRPVSRVCLKNKNNNNQVTTNFDERKTSTNRQGRQEDWDDGQPLRRLRGGSSLRIIPATTDQLRKGPWKVCYVFRIESTYRIQGTVSLRKFIA